VTPPPNHLQTLVDLEARHDELLCLLDDLEKRVAAVLAQYQAPREAVATLRTVAVPSGPTG